MKVDTTTGTPIKMWTDGVPVEDQAMEQLRNTSRLPFVDRMAVMPDVHLGIGATIGSVVPMRGALVPAAVGVDIGCGMSAHKLLSVRASDLPDNLAGIRSTIEAAVPVGFAAHPEPLDHALRLFDKYLSGIEAGYGYGEVVNRNLFHAKADPRNQMGTLGGGNHFIELCIDENQDVWLMLHSGSRGVGNRIGRHFIELAKRECEKWKIELPDPDLAWLPEETPLFDAYVAAVGWAQEYARLNRVVMKSAIMSALRGLGAPFGWITEYSQPAEEVVDCHHNYVEKEHHFGQNVWVTRKGAVRAREGDLGIIPGSMGAKSYIVRGLGNAESLNSCSHGAGRVMSRTAAKKRYTEADMAMVTLGVECRKDSGVVDEIPHAYKDIDAVMAAQSDLVEPIHTLKQIVCVKG